MPDPQPWQATGDGLSVELKVTPGAKADRVDGVERQDDGTVLLREIGRAHV